jgi:hypothetical protein
MVLRSFGLEATQSEIWPQVGRPEGGRRWSASTHRLGRYLIGRGLQVAIVRGRDPWRLLQRCARPELRVIVRHRARFLSSSGHYSLLRGLSDGEVVLHDPLGRPNRRLHREAFLYLWGPSDFGIDRGYLLMVCARPSNDPPCSCGRWPMPFDCPQCLSRVTPGPGVAIGCGPDCPDRHWSEYFCPHCDGRLEMWPAPEGDDDADTRTA